MKNDQRVLKTPIGFRKERKIHKKQESSFPAWVIQRDVWKVLGDTGKVTQWERNKKIYLRELTKTLNSTALSFCLSHSMSLCLSFSLSLSLPSLSISMSLSLSLSHTPHTHLYIYIYIYIFHRTVFFSNLKNMSERYDLRPKAYGLS